MKLNCDLGEGLNEIDEAIMPFIDMANIACGGHTGDEYSMARTVKLAKFHKVQIGAHPSYPDKIHFGRASLSIPKNELYESLIIQVNNLDKVCKKEKVQLEHIKAHGALYNDMVADRSIFQLVCDLAKHFHLPLVVFADDQKHKMKNPRLLFEAFADRAYSDSGNLVSRKIEGSVYRDPHKCASQAFEILTNNRVQLQNKTWLPLKADTICVHGDSENALGIAKEVRLKINNLER